MDKTLLRPLFRQTALHVKQIETDDIPTYFWGGLAAMGGRLGPSIAKGYRTFKGARGARAAAGEAGWMKTGIGRLRGAGSHPYTQRGLLGLQAGAVGAGGVEAKRAAFGQESVIGEGPATFGGAFALGYGGLGFGSRAIAGGKMLPKYQATAKKIAEKTPGVWPLTIGGAVTGMVESGARQSITHEKKHRLTTDQTEALKSQLDKLGPDATVNDARGVVNSFDFTPEQKTRVYETLGITPGATVPGTTTANLAEPKNIEGQAATIAGTATEEPVSPVLLQPDEQKRKAISIQNATKAANKEVEKFTLSDRGKEIAQEFADLKGAITSVTGNNDNANLLLLKMASGLMTGKSTKSGLSGLMDITGQAMGPTIDTAMILAQNQKDFDQKLALNVVENLQERENLILEAQLEGSGGTQIESAREYVRIQTDDWLGADVVEVGVDTDTGKRISIIPGPGGEQFAPYEGAGQAVTPNPSKQADYDAVMQDAALGIQMASFVEAADDSVLGPNASISEFSDKVSGVLGAVGGLIGGGDVNSVATYNKIIDQTYEHALGNTKGLSDAELESREKEARAMINDFKTSEEQLRKKYGALGDIGNPKRRAIAQLAYIENRMAYLIANTYKPTDRLTVKDIELAKENVAIIEFFNNPKRIKEKYRTLNRDLSEAFIRNAKSYVTVGGGSASHIYSSYQSVPIVANEWRKRQEKLQKQEVPTADQQKLYEENLESLL